MWLYLANRKHCVPFCLWTLVQLISHALEQISYNANSTHHIYALTFFGQLPSSKVCAGIKKPLISCVGGWIWVDKRTPWDMCVKLSIPQSVISLKAFWLIYGHVNYGMVVPEDINTMYECPMLDCSRQRFYIVIAECAIMLNGFIRGLCRICHSYSSVT